jgi:hypothetical protein
VEVRMMLLRATLAVASGLALTACAAPLVMPAAPSFQSKAQHVSDWNGLAERSVARFSEALGSNAPIVFVAPGPADMPFAAAYRTLLEQELLERHFRVQETAQGAVVLRFDVQTFLYGSHDEKLPIDYASFWTTASALGVQLRHVSQLDTGVGIAGAAGPVLDVLASLYDTTKAEAFVTTSVSDGSRLFYRDTETLYVHPTELPFYWTRVPDFTPQTKIADVADADLPVHGGTP